VIVVGVDPGKWGAIAVIAPTVDAPLLYPMPVIRSTNGRDEYNEAEIARLLGGALAGQKGVTVFLEKGQPLPPKMGGTVANFQRGYARGLFVGILTALRIPYELVAPRVWQREMHGGTSGDDLKQRSIIAAQRLFPGVSLLRTVLSRKPDDGLAEALLIAEWGRRKLAGWIEEAGVTLDFSRESLGGIGKGRE